MKITECKYKRGKVKGQSFYCPIGSLSEYIREFGRPLITRLLVTQFHSEFFKCTSMDKARERMTVLKHGKRKEFGRSELKKSMLLALKMGKVKEARKLFAQLTRV